MTATPISERVPPYVVLLNCSGSTGGTQEGGSACVAGRRREGGGEEEGGGAHVEVDEAERDGQEGEDAEAHGRRGGVAQRVERAAGEDGPELRGGQAGRGRGRGRCKGTGCGDVPLSTPATAHSLHPYTAVPRPPPRSTIHPSPSNGPVRPVRTWTRRGARPMSPSVPPPVLMSSSSPCAVAGSSALRDFSGATEAAAMAVAPPAAAPGTPPSARPSTRFVRAACRQGRREGAPATGPHDHPSTLTSWLCA